MLAERDMLGRAKAGGVGRGARSAGEWLPSSGEEDCMAFLAGADGMTWESVKEGGRREKAWGKLMGV